MVTHNSNRSVGFESLRDRKTVFLSTKIGPFYSFRKRISQTTNDVKRKQNYE